MPIEAEFDSYWRLETYGKKVYKSTVHHQLQGSRIPDLGYMSKSELVEKKSRIDRGLIIYEKYPDSQLREFVKSRNLPTNNGLSLAKTLYYADAMAGDKKFEKFLDLPAELRTRIYHYYIQTLPETLRFPTPPPIARTSSLVRKEVLPIFYQKSEFVLEYKYSKLFGQHSVQPTMDTVLFLHHLPLGQAINLRRLRLEIKGMPACFELRVHVGGKSWGTPVPSRYYTDSMKTREQKFNTRAEVLKTMKNLKEGRFTIEDVYTLRHALETALAK